jgi:uncharacterized protein (DUF362 family)/NAD-dependent dihydropyrimidine dehydrogenase PreA subunit
LVRFRVAVTPCPDYDREQVQSAIRRLVEAIPRCLDGLNAGDRVFLKPNLLMPRSPELCVTTHPEVVSAVGMEVSGRGLAPVIGDSPGGPFNPGLLRRLYAETAMAQAAGDCNGELNYDTEAVEVEGRGLEVERRFTFCRAMVEAAALVNLCKLKTHGLTGLTAGVKNLFGCVPGLLKTEYHMTQPTVEAFSDVLTDIARIMSPRLTIMDAVDAMEGAGPSHGTPRRIGLLFASADPFALDYAVARMLSVGPEGFTTLAAALRRGYGPQDDEQLEIAWLGPGESPTILTGDKAVRLLRSLAPSSFGLLSPENLASLHGRGMVRRVLRSVQPWLRTRPELSPGLCSGCGTCARACPAGALVLKSRRPKIDLRRCIRCYCCQELCPQGALRIIRPIGSWLLYRRR